MAFQPPQRSPLQRLVWITFGWVCLLIGFIGGLLPVLQGWPFGIAGLIILSREQEWAYRLVQRLRNRFPRFARIMDKTAEHSERIIRKFGRKAAP